MEYKKMFLGIFILLLVTIFLCVAKEKTMRVTVENDIKMKEKKDRFNI